MSNFIWFPDLAVEHNQDEYDFLRNQAQIGRLRRLDQSECISTFAKDFVQTASAVVLVTVDSVEWNKSVLNSYTPLMAALEQTVPYFWMCDSGPARPVGLTCDKEQDASHGNWDVYGHAVDFCLVADADEKCTIQLR